MSYTRIHRLLRILTLIQSQRGWNAKRLADECEVEERTIYRDLKELEGAGVPVLFDQEKQGYQVRGDFFLPPVQLTPEEALALAVLCEQVAEKEQIAFLRPAWRALSKIEARLPPSIREELATLGKRIAVRTARTNPPDSYGDVYDKIQKAISDTRALQCAYDSTNSGAAGDVPPDGAQDHFIFEPYSLFFCVRAWYTIGHHGGRGEVRSLKLSRFTAVCATDQAYKIPTDFSLDAYLGNAWRMIRGRNDYEVEIWFDAEFAQTMSDTQWHPTQKIEFHDDGSATFRCTVSGLDEIVWWVLGMGPHCHVKRPMELRDRVRQLAVETVGIYV